MPLREKKMSPATGLSSSSDPVPERVSKPLVAENIESCRQVAKKASALSFKLSDGLPINMTEEELKTVLTQRAKSLGDRATLLDARDRLIRLKKGAAAKTNNSSKISTTLKGTCLDMCPEKERYSRAEKRRLAPYELVASQVKWLR